MSHHATPAAPKGRGRRTLLRACASSSFLCLLLLTTSGCAGDEGRDAEATPPAAEERESEREREFERLASLPYAGSAAGSADEEEGVLLAEPESMAPGLTLYTTKKTCRARLVDHEGSLVHEWSVPSCFHWGGMLLLDDERAVVVGTDEHEAEGGLDGRREARYIARIAWDNRVVWRRDEPFHHDVSLAPDGRIVALVERPRPIEAIAPGLLVRNSALALLDPESGRITEEHSLLDALLASSERVTLLPTVRQRIGDDVEADPLHANSAILMTPETAREAGLPAAARPVLVTSRHQNMAFLVDLDAQAVPWAWGQGRTEGPHAARPLPGGRVLLFDNGLVRGQSRVIELEPESGKVVWEWTEPSFYTRSRGAAERLANGNTLVTDSNSGRLLEVTRKGRVVWEYLTPDRVPDSGERSTMFRAARVPLPAPLRD